MDTLFSSVLEKGEARGIALGEARGRAERERELVLSLLEDGMPVARVARVSKLTEEEVLDIARGGDTPS